MSWAGLAPGAGAEGARTARSSEQLKPSWKEAAAAARTVVQPKSRDSEAPAGRSWIAGAWEL